MTYNEAISELQRVKETLSISEEESEAIDMAIEQLAEKTLSPMAECKCCGKKFRRVPRTWSTDDMNITTWTAKCPYCGTIYEWNDCYWR